MRRRKYQFKSILEESLGDAPLDHILNEAPAGAVPVEIELARQDPPMALRDEIIFLLHTAAEIEHALMVQYLYSAYSLPESGPQAEWRASLTSIAKEEMGHLLSVQNALLAIGGSLNFDREDYPFNEFYPFKFALEPFSLKSVARYVLAEMPHVDQIPPALGFDLAQVRRDAEVGDSDETITRVGALFKLLIRLVQNADPAVLMRNPEEFQGRPSVWRAAFHGLIVERVSTREGIIELLEAIAEQGEGADEPADESQSHFLRLFSIYKQAAEFEADNPGVSPALPVPTNPTVNDEEEEGFIQNPTAALWADIFNHRFRWILASIAMHLQLPDGQERGILSQWALNDMIALTLIARHLVAMPQHTPPRLLPSGAVQVAGPPFELPYTLNLPNQTRAIWRHQKMLTEQSFSQLARLPTVNSLSSRLKMMDQQKLTYLNSILDAAV